jgi:hypothetical protein
MGIPVQAFVRNSILQTLSDDLDTGSFMQIFVSVRDNVGNFEGLQLTLYGLQLLRRRFQAWSFPMPAGFAVRPCHLLCLDRQTTMPWFLDYRRLVLFEAQLAMRFKLAGDLDRFIAAFHSDSDSQSL